MSISLSAKTLKTVRNKRLLDVGRTTLANTEWHSQKVETLLFKKKSILIFGLYLSLNLVVSLGSGEFIFLQKLPMS
jgi:hypothetical protein